LSAAALAVSAVFFALALRERPHTLTIQRSAVVRIVRAYHERPAAWDPQTRRRLQEELSDALSPALARSQDWSSAVLAQDGSLLYADRPDSAVIPASTQKLIVADAALALLGAQYRFSTLLAAEQPPQNGRIAGDLWLIGSGDPSLRSSAIIRGVRALRARSIDAIAGGVAVDGSSIAGDEINPAWNATDANEDFMAATSGMSLDEDTVEFHVRGTSDGSPAEIYINPPTAPITYEGAAVTGSYDDVVIAGTQAPNPFRIYGTIPPEIKETFYLPVHGIPQYAGRVMTGLLRRSGIEVARNPVTGAAPLDAVALWNHRSGPLVELLRHMLVLSDNHYAEQLMRTLGGVDGAAANDANGIAAEMHVLQAQGIPLSGIHLVDGSGLSEQNRISAMTLARVLSHLDADPQGNLLYPLLARGGRDGTLRMYRFTSAAGRVRAKSGHLADASALAGYVQTRGHGRVAFAFLIDGSSQDADDAVVAAVDRLALQ